MFTPDGGGIGAYESIVALMAECPDNRSAVRFFEEARWPDGVVCPFCGGGRTSPIASRLRHRCLDCDKQFSVRTDSVFADTNLPLHKWLYAMYFFVTSRKGISSYALAKYLGITQKSAWFLLHRLREAMRVERPKLSGIVEVDETYIGGIEGNKHADKKIRSGRGPVGKQAVIGFRQRGGPIVAFPMGRRDVAAVTTMVRGTVESGASVYTDEASWYDRVGVEYRHRFVRHSKGHYVSGDVYTNSIESVWALVKRAHKGVYHHWHPKNTRRYMDEVVFRLNAKGSTMETLRAMARGSVGKRLTYDVLTRVLQTGDGGQAPTSLAPYL